MIRLVKGWALWSLPVAISMLGTACRESDPPNAYNQDLGENGELLLPTAAVSHRTSIADSAKTDWIDFREPSDADQASSDMSGGGGRPNNAEVEAEIREVVADFNALFDDEEATVDDFLFYFVENRREAVKPLLEAAPALAETLQQLRDELQAKKPDESDRIATLIEAVEATVGPEMILKSVTVNSDTDATVTLAGGMLGSTFQFVIVDDEWCVQIPDADALQAAVPVLDQKLKTYRGWLDDLKAGRTSPDEVLQSIDAAAQAVEAPTPDESDESGD